MFTDMCAHYYMTTSVLNGPKTNRLNYVKRVSLLTNLETKYKLLL